TLRLLVVEARLPLVLLGKVPQDPSCPGPGTSAGGLLPEPCGEYPLLVTSVEGITARDSATVVDAVPQTRVDVVACDTLQEVPHSERGCRPIRVGTCVCKDAAEFAVADPEAPTLLEQEARLLDPVTQAGGVGDTVWPGSRQPAP